MHRDSALLSVYFFISKDFSDFSPEMTVWRVEKWKCHGFSTFMTWNNYFSARKKVLPSSEFYARDLVRSSSCGWTFDSEINWQKLCLSLGALWLRVGWIRTKLVLVSLSIHPLFWGGKTRFVRPHHRQELTNKPDHASGIICEKFFNLSEKAELLYGIQWERWRKNRARPPISADKNMQNFASQDNNYHSSSSLSVVVLFVSLSWNLILNTIIVSPVVVLDVKSSKEFDFEKGCCKLLGIALHLSSHTFPIKVIFGVLEFCLSATWVDGWAERCGIQDPRWRDDSQWAAVVEEIKLLILDCYALPIPEEQYRCIKSSFRYSLLKLFV